ncbi:MAG: M50 family metallopeptidase [Bacteroidota bacterium]
MNYVYLVLLTFALALLVNYLPYVGKVFRVVNTLFHESAHAFMALFTNAEVVRINLFSDSSGSALTKSKYWISKFLVSVAGYAGASVAGYFLWKLFLHNQLTIVFFVFILLAIINLIFWVRNWYGIIWLLVFIGILATSFLYLPLFYHRFILLFFLSSIIINSLSSAFVLLRISFKEPKQAGDAANLKLFTFIPAIVWSLLFFAFAGYMVYLEAFLFKLFIKF